MELKKKPKEISKKMLETLTEIQNQEKNNGAAITKKINTYEHPNNLYRTLEKLTHIEAVKKQAAPHTASVKNTYVTTDFGKTLLQKMQIEK